MSRYKDELNLAKLGANLTKRREGLRLSVEDVSEMTGFSAQTIRNIEAGEESSLSYVIAICQALELHPTKAFDFNNYVKKLHPTPALGAFPKKAGAEWLLGYQKKVDRKSYGAPFGYYHPPSQKVTCIVAIRQIQWGNRKIRIGAGCGVIAQSSLEKEWQEILLKIKKYVKKNE